MFSTEQVLVADDTNGQLDVYVRDLKKKRTERVSIASDGQQSSSASTTCWTGGYMGRRISRNGRYVTFWSLATDLVPNDGNNFHDVFVHDRDTGRTNRISVDSYGQAHDRASRLSAISSNGRYVVFESFNPFTSQDSVTVPLYLVDAAQGGDLDIFIQDRSNGATEMMSLDTSGNEARNCIVQPSENPLQGIVDHLGSDPTAPFSTSASVSGDGRFVGFVSCADNLVPNDRNLSRDAFVRDRGEDQGVNSLGGPPPAPLPVPLPLPIPIPPDVPGERGKVPAGVFEVDEPSGDAAPFVSDETFYDVLGGKIAYRPALRDLFVTIEVDKLAVPATLSRVAADMGALYVLRFEASGAHYEVRATLGRIGLFRCSAAHHCLEEATLRGGYGTTGERIVLSLPLNELRLDKGERLTDVEFVSGQGTYVTGIVRVADRAPG
jgi:hypothetical protein